MKKSKFLIFRAGVLFTVCYMLLAATSPESGQNKIEDATSVLHDFSKMKGKIPKALIDQSQAIIVIPKLINAGFVIGGKRGKGLAMVKNEDGKWSDPSFITLTGGSVGFQAGVQSIDLVLVFKHRKTLLAIGKGSFTLGGDISVAAGPVGRNSTANTDYKLEAEVYSYSRSRGLFAGISLNGASITIDTMADQEFYKNSNDAKTLLSDSKSTLTSVKELKESVEGL